MLCNRTTLFNTNKKLSKVQILHCMYTSKYISLINPMTAMASYWNLRQLKCSVIRWAIPCNVTLTLGNRNTISLPSGRLALATLNTLVQPLSTRVCRVCNIGFMNVVCTDSICSGFWPFMTTVLPLLSTAYTYKNMFISVAFIQIHIWLHNTPCQKKIVPFFLFFF